MNVSRFCSRKAFCARKFLSARRHDFSRDAEKTGEVAELLRERAGIFGGSERGKNEWQPCDPVCYHNSMRMPGILNVIRQEVQTWANFLGV
jgi:hypothetical protein